MKLNLIIPYMIVMSLMLISCSIFERDTKKENQTQCCANCYEDLKYKIVDSPQYVVDCINMFEGGKGETKMDDVRLYFIRALSKILLDDLEGAEADLKVVLESKNTNANRLEVSQLIYMPMDYLQNNPVDRGGIRSIAKLIATNIDSVENENFYDWFMNPSNHAPKDSIIDTTWYNDTIYVTNKKYIWE